MAELTKRLIELANQLENRTTLYALDALRNLFVQAHLIERTEFADQLLAEGLVSLCETVIEKAIA